MVFKFLSIAEFLATIVLTLLIWSRKGKEVDTIVIKWDSANWLGILKSGWKFLLHCESFQQLPQDSFLHDFRLYILKKKEQIFSVL